MKAEKLFKGLESKKEGKLRSGSAIGSDRKSREQVVVAHLPQPREEPTGRQVDTATYTQRQEVPHRASWHPGVTRVDGRERRETGKTPTNRSAHAQADDQCQ